jgi:manganese transport protein
MLTMLPAIIIIAIGVNATEALVMSQIVLSIALPVPMVSLLILSSRRSIMGPFASSPPIRAMAFMATVLVLAIKGLDNFELPVDAMLLLM